MARARSHDREPPPRDSAGTRDGGVAGREADRRAGDEEVSAGRRGGPPGRGGSPPAKRGSARRAARGYRDLREHLDELRRRGLLLAIDRPIDKDAELHPLVRWQYVGGVEEHERRAFLFTNVVDGLGRKYRFPVVVGAYAGNRAIYCAGMGVEAKDVEPKWACAIAGPVPPRVVTRAPCQDVVLTGAALRGAGRGLDMLPIPVSTPGFDGAPTLTATNVITKDPETGIHNHGTYRAGLKAPDRLVVRMATRIGGAGGYRHYLKHRRRGDRAMPCAIALGSPPCVAFVAPMKLPVDVDEIGVAGGVAGGPVNVVRARTVDLLVPAEAEIVIEGLIDTEYLEPEGPFGESHGHVALEEFNMPMRVTAITHRRDAIVASYLSQVTPSESSAIKRVSYEPMFLAHLRGTLGIRGVTRVTLHERMTALRRIAIVTVEKGMARTEVWRALYGVASFRADCGKICVAVNEDIDPDNSDALLWAMAFRMNPAADLQVLPCRSPGHGPEREHVPDEPEPDASVLIDATMKEELPPLALPKREYMERARKVWEELGLPRLRPQSPWFGTPEGDWLPQWDAAAKRAAEGRYLENGKASEKLRRKGLKPETRYRPAEKKRGG
ncbi:MAG: UbiD family decarboxylase [Burkholderiales bacterium]|nr:UbiD family decarboxylase [Burkholderiales bacterium]